MAIMLFVSAIVCTAFTMTIRNANEYDNNAISLQSLFAILLFFVSLYFISRKGLFRLSAYLLIGTFFCLAFYMVYRWSIELLAGSLFFVLVIIMAGILIGSRFAYIVTALASLSIVAVCYLQINQIIEPNLFWKHNETFGITEAVVLSLILFFIATISWLSDRQVKKSLARARKSEAELKVEKDLLEIRVEEKTKELQRAQMEKMMQIHRFAEFGRLSGGLFHDLANPLTALSLFIERIKLDRNKSANFEEMETNLGSIKKTAVRIEKLISSVKKQISNQEISEVFSLNREIEEALQLLAYKSRKNRVNLKFNTKERIETLGNPVKFSQIVTNLAANAIDAYPAIKVEENTADRNVVIELLLRNKTITLAVKDWGIGIQPEEMSKIFEPFYTTKKYQDGLGIGLPLVKEMAEKDFNGHIEAYCAQGKGTVFVFTFNQKSL
jgi:C4-dicarboxylate-specific signal transduction histidine kinase